MTTLTERLNKLLFRRCIGSVLDTPPMQRGINAFMALSMVHTRDVASYLLAIKSFARGAAPERVAVVADPSITAEDRETLKRHIPHLEILEAADFRHPTLPVGGTWERLSAIAAMNADVAIVQVDADTLTTGPLDELVGALTEGRSAILRSEAGVEIVSLDQAAELGRRLRARTQHIQVLCESRLDELPGAGGLRYVRGCSGFTAFARGSLAPDRVRWLSTSMRQLHGARWDDWGSEQFASNLLAASAPAAWMLPHPRYCNADSRTGETRLTHFIGYARFTSRTYEREARRLIDTLRMKN